MEIPNDFYTTVTLFSLSGSSTAVLVITSVIGYLLEPRDSRTLKKWLGLFLSIFLALIGATQVQEKDSLTWIVAIIRAPRLIQILRGEVTWFQGFQPLKTRYKAINRGAH